MRGDELAMSTLDREDVEVLDEKQDRMTISVGPHHPSTHGVLRLVLELEGETIVKAQPEHGFLHTGIEKSAENLTWTQAITVLDRMDYLSPLSNNLGYVLAVEKLLGVEVPPKAVWARVLLTELQRIASHLVFLGTGGLDVGAQSPYFYAFDMREGILDIFEETTGARMNPSYFRVGGLAKDLPEHFDRIVRDYLKKFPGRLQELKDLLEENPIFLDRTKGIGVLTAEQAIALGLTGPNLRASGVAYDVRKAFPYCGYENFQFDVPVGKNGDAYDRFVLRIREIEESYKIVQQALDGMPEGPHMTSNRKVALPPKEEVRHSMEALIHHFKLVSEGFKVPAGEVYQAIESPRGEFAVYVVSDGGNKPWRVRVRPPSFYAVHALPTMLQGAMLADMVMIIAAADPVFGEVDR
ncbi:NADH dehydrogenase (quinone) subunit D [Caldinitratiruptor microaerophilus]|uniref:NADH-quinone oxidoreductase subunit D n=1 Tax=Caldinitratiruptor microaerophilus TaxID=671077 RepID=A0AA35G6W5_9FIRM|nr:NADH dehydrogenase (quinone) subunit D [Caldinitratiruptor microaerophilus]BDG59451.1 NADH-quinone oxidoreductase subunit D 2 [Caldinitratiruptor microaerophilus]